MPEAKVKPFEWNPDTISKALENKEIDEEHGTNLYLDWRLRGNMYDMEPDEVEAAMTLGKMNTDQVEKYLDRKENPAWWYTKDLTSGAVKGIEKGIENIVTSVNELPVISHTIDAWNWLMPERINIKKKADFNVGISEPESLPGKLTEGITQFSTAFIPASKMVQALSIGTKIMNSGKLVTFAKDLPKLRGFITASVDGMAAGAAADYSAFDPFQGRAVDFIKDLGALPEFLDFMTTKEDNPAALERFKNVLEGAVIGGAFDTILFGVRALKSAAYYKYFGDLDALAQELNNVPRLSKAYDSAKVRELDEMAKRPKIHEGSNMGDEKIVQPGGSQEVEKLTNFTKTPEMGLIKEQETRSYKIFKKITEGEEPIFDDNFIGKMEKFEDAQSIVRHVYDEAEDVIKKARGHQTHLATEISSTQEIKKLADAVGGDPDGIMNHMRNIYGEIKGATTKARMMYRTLTTYADNVGKMCKKYTGDVSETLRIIEHLKLLQELQAMVYGVRAESGRLLNMHNMKHSKARFDFSNFKTMDNLPDYVTKNKEKFEGLIKEYGNKGSLEEKLKFTRFLGKGGITHWLLSLSQAAKLWSPVTHLVNTTSQTGALAFRFIARTIGSTAMSINKLDPVYMKGMVKELAGLGQAVKVCFEKPKGLLKVHKTALSEGISMKKALMKDPEIGTFYKAFFGREGIIDPSIKWDEAAISLSQSSLAKVGRTLDAIIKIPFNFLSGVDEVFKTIGTQMDYFARVYDEGIQKGFRGDSLDSFFKDATKRGRPDYFNEALKVGKEVTFQDDLGKMAKFIEQALNANPAGLGIRAFFIPFYKTTVNLMKYAGKNSVLGLASKTVREGLAAGGVKTYETIARMAMGTAAMYWAWNAYEDGKITGRLPVDQRSILRSSGVLEYAFYNDKTREWMSMRRGDPFALWLALSADMHMAMDVYAQYEADNMDVEFEDVFAAFLGAAVEPTINATWMRGMKDFMEFIGDPEKSKHKAKQVGIKLVEGMIPGTTLIDYINSEFGSDSYYREMHDLLDIIWKKLDSTKLLPRRDPVYGTPVEKVDRWGHIINKSIFTDDPVKLTMIETGTNVRSPRDYLVEEGERIKLTPDKLDRFQEIYSKFPVKEVLTGIVTNDSFKNIGDDATKSQIIQSVISEFRTATKALFEAENPEITQELINKIVNKAQAIAGFIEAKNSSAALYYWMQQEEEGD